MYEPGLGLNLAPATVLFLDLNSAFASIEQQYDASLRGRPVVVAPGAARASAVISASREARGLGVRTGDRVWQVAPRVPDLIVVEPDPAKYLEVSRKVMDLLGDYSPQVLPLSIDEAAVDLAGTPSLGRDLLELGREVKARLRDEVGDWLLCSIGFAPNVFLAKQAAQFQKPDGLVLIDHRNLVQVLGRLQLTDLTGISDRTARRLGAAGIQTPLDLLSASRHTLRRQAFRSIIGEAWYLRLRGFPVGDFQSHERKSLSHSHVLPQATGRAEDLEALVLKLCDRLGRRLRKLEMVAGRIELKVRLGDGEILGRSRREERLAATVELNRAAHRLWSELGLGGRQVRFVSLALTELSPVGVAQLDLFAEGGSARRDKASAAVDRLRDRFGEGAVIPARLIGKEGVAKEAVAFGKVVGPHQDSKH